MSAAKNPERITQMQNLLRENLQAQDVDITDDSHLHAGHAGARDGAGHFTLTIVADAFVNKSAVERHRLVYAALGDMMGPDIHALSIKAHSPDEL